MNEKSLNQEDKALLQHNQQKILRIELLKQMQASENEKLQRQLQDLEKEQTLNKQIAEQASTIMEVEIKSKLADQEHFRKTWDAQIDLLDSSKRVDALF